MNQVVEETLAVGSCSLTVPIDRPVQNIITNVQVTFHRSKSLLCCYLFAILWLGVLATFQNFKNFFLRFEMNKVNLKLPEWDEDNQRPKTQTPACPKCKEDNLAMIEADRCVCYTCGLDLIKINHSWYIVEVPKD